jgi:MOSC domain-containing protein YiiM
MQTSREIRRAHHSSGRVEAFTIQGLFISPEHNFFGHHGRGPGTAAMFEVDQIECLAGRGIRGDRFLDYAENYKGQITFFSQEVFAALVAELKLPQARPSALRRNVLVSGADLNRLVGMKFQLQDVWFEGVEECRPCYWMDSALGPGAEAWLRGRGGLRARILTDGILRRDG